MKLSQFLWAFACISLLQLLPTAVHAQSISGPTTAMVGQQVGYTTDVNAWRWTCTGCTVQSSTSNSAQVVWNTTGTGTLRAWYGFAHIAYNVNVLAGCTPYTVNFPGITSGSDDCDAQLSYSISEAKALNPNAGISQAYYWQTSPTGTSTTQSSNQYTVGNTGTYYLRALETATGCWSDNVQTYTLGSMPSDANSPSLVSSCGTNSLEMNNSTNATFTYYWQTSATGTDVTNSTNTLQVVNNGTYYVRAKHNQSGCWGASSTGVYATADGIDSPPTATADVNLPDNSVSEVATGTTNLPTGTAQVNLDNYVRTYTPIQAGVTSTDFTLLQSYASDQVRRKTSYVDGIGRVVQTVSQAASPLGNDMVALNEFDEYGRQTKQYLPFAANESTGNFKSNARLSQYQFYQTAEGVAHTDWAFSEVSFDKSPLDRTVGEAAPGKSWVGENRTTSMEYLLNESSDNIRFWQVDYGMAQNLTSPFAYSNGDLKVEKTTNEQGNIVLHYQDNFDRKVLTRAVLENGEFADTYFVYDGMENLRYVLPPKATVLLAANNWLPNTEIDKLVFRYHYDGKGRFLVKKIPSKGEIYFVYDQLGRIILTQDAKQRANGQWLFTKYDRLSRSIQTGIFHTAESHLNLINIVYSQSSDEELLSNSQYSNTAYPIIHTTAGDQILSESFYDDYNAVDMNTYAYTPVTTIGFNNPIVSDRTKGLITATRVRILGTNNWLWTVIHYDRKARMIQAITDNHIGGQDIITTEFEDFNAWILKEHFTHTSTTQQINILKRFEYDHVGRTSKVFFQVNNQAEELLVELNYNELGQEVSKRLGGGLQKIDYSYNIRGWLMKINGLDLETQEAGERKDLWGMELSYDAGFSKKQYAGNIAGMKWKSASDGIERAYGYQYDKLDRLTQADYRYIDDTGNPSIANEDFSVFGIKYDLNGNILKLNRQGTVSQNPSGEFQMGAMDRLSYHYDGNQLIAVDDAVNTTKVGTDFDDSHQRFCSTNQVEYEYDENGSLVEDKNKGITSIEYNHLELPIEIITTEGKIVYTYDAAGIKLKKEIYNASGVLQQTKDYVGGLVYQDGEIEFIPHAEGRLIPDDHQEFKFEYHYKDHLGNLRLSFREEKAEYMVTMESANANDEEENFDHVNKTRIFSANNNLGFAHTGEAAAQLNGANAQKTMGPATIVSVQRGDKIAFSGYSKYSNGSNFGVANNLSIPALGANHNFGQESAGFLGNGTGIIFSPLNTLNNNNNIPNAYAVIHLLDEDGQVIESYEQFVSQGANNYQSFLVEVEVDVKEAKYAAIYVANESPTDVYFDDLKLTHERLIWQENNYYPFGLAITPLNQSGVPDHKFTYNGKELEEHTNYIEFESRLHDPQLGRFHSIDPKSEWYVFQSPYTYATNNPIKFIEFRGESSKPTTSKTKDFKDKVAKKANDAKKAKREANKWRGQHYTILGGNSIHVADANSSDSESNAVKFKKFNNTKKLEKYINKKQLDENAEVTEQIIELHVWGVSDINYVAKYKVWVIKEENSTRLAIVNTVSNGVDQSYPDFDIETRFTQIDEKTGTFQLQLMITTKSPNINVAVNGNSGSVSTDMPLGPSTTHTFSATFRIFPNSLDSYGNIEGELISDDIPSHMIRKRWWWLNQKHHISWHTSIRGVK